MMCVKTLSKMKISKVEERIREALAERAARVTLAQFEKDMKAIADGR
jgi:hypothetical protein